jgi:hypothetical protein
MKKIKEEEVGVVFERRVAIILQDLSSRKK